MTSLSTRSRLQHVQTDEPTHGEPIQCVNITTASSIECGQTLDFAINHPTRSAVYLQQCQQAFKTQNHVELTITIKSRPGISLLIQTPGRTARIVDRRTSEISNMLPFEGASCCSMHNCGVIPTNKDQQSSVSSDKERPTKLSNRQHSSTQH